jgi:DNA-directed RNA polymerase subunit RPC12/RpoP
MNYYDDNSKCIRADCPKCGKSFEQSLEWIARHPKRKTWDCPHCNHRFKVFVQAPDIDQSKPLPTMAEILHKGLHDRRQGFYSKVAGVSHQNANGTSRQEIIRRCRAGERLTLVCDPLNPVDPNAVMVLRSNGEQLGYLTAHLAADLCDQVSAGESIPCYIANLTGLDREMRGVNIYIGDELPIDRDRSEQTVAPRERYPSIYPSDNAGTGSAVIGALTILGIIVTIAYALSR